MWIKSAHRSFELGTLQNSQATALLHIAFHKDQLTKERTGQEHTPTLTIAWKLAVNKNSNSRSKKQIVNPLHTTSNQVVRRQNPFWRRAQHSPAETSTQTKTSTHEHSRSSENSPLTDSNSRSNEICCTTHHIKLITDKITRRTAQHSTAQHSTAQTSARKKKWHTCTLIRTRTSTVQIGQILQAKALLHVAQNYGGEKKKSARAETITHLRQRAAR